MIETPGARLAELTQQAPAADAAGKQTQAPGASNGAAEATPTDGVASRNANVWQQLEADMKCPISCELMVDPVLAAG